MCGIGKSAQGGADLGVVWSSKRVHVPERVTARVITAKESNAA